MDAPAHAGKGWQWGEAAGLGQLALCVNKQPWPKYCIVPPCGQLNPNLYRVLQDLYRDILDVFEMGQALHMGGDEVLSSEIFWGRRPHRVNKLLGQQTAAEKQTGHAESTD